MWNTIACHIPHSNPFTFRLNRKRIDCHFPPQYTERVASFPTYRYMDMSTWMSCNAQSRFDFQHVLGPTCSQQEVYEHTVRPWGHMLAIKTDEGLHIQATFWPVLLTRERWGPPGVAYGGRCAARAERCGHCVRPDWLRHAPPLQTYHDVMRFPTSFKKAFLRYTTHRFERIKLRYMRFMCSSERDYLQGPGDWSAS